jgi:hypothetical protein
MLRWKHSTANLPFTSHARQTTLNPLTVRLSSFAFAPDHLRLKAGMPVRLRLVNESSGGHDFSAPGFFAASSILPGSLEPPNGDVTVGSHQTVELAVVPHTLGTYPLKCTHFLHSFVQGQDEAEPQRLAIVKSALADLTAAWDQERTGDVPTRTG